MTRYSKEEKARAVEYLHKFTRPGDRLYTILRNVSRSGMSRDIDIYSFRDDSPVYLSGYAAVILEYPRPKNGIRVGGCGMDMGFSLVSGLSYELFPDGFSCIGLNCPHNSHNNYFTSKGYESYGFDSRAEFDAADYLCFLCGKPIPGSAEKRPGRCITQEYICKECADPGNPNHGLYVKYHYGQTSYAFRHSWL